MQEEVLDGIQVNPVPSLGAGILGHQGMGVGGGSSTCGVHISLI